MASLARMQLRRLRAQRTVFVNPERTQMCVTVPSLTLVLPLTIKPPVIPKKTMTTLNDPLTNARWDNTPEMTLDGHVTEARVLDVYDGDTMTVAMPWKDGVYRFTLRLLGINAEEIKGTAGDVKERANAARVLLAQNVSNGRFQIDSKMTRAALRKALDAHDCRVRVECKAFDKYGRVLANVYSTQEGACLSKILLDSGLVRSYMVSEPSEAT